MRLRRLIPLLRYASPLPSFRGGFILIARQACTFQSRTISAGTIFFPYQRLGPIQPSLQFANYLQYRYL